MLEPQLSHIRGGTVLTIRGEGLFDSVSKKAKIVSKFGDRLTDLQWDRNEKVFQLTSMPFYWIANDDELIKTISPSDLLDLKFEVSITMNYIHWEPAGFYRYCDLKIMRMTYATFPDKSTLEDVI